MKRFSLSCVCVLAFLISSAQQRVINISNPLPTSREEVIEIAWKNIATAYPKLDTSNFKVVDAASKKEYAYQLEYNGNSEVQNLLVQVQINSGGSIKLQLVKGEPKKNVSKTFCRFVPERKDDFAWENDRIAHRVYGKALEKTPKEMAYGVDVWVKRTDSLVINKRYQRGKYHQDAGDGLDYYHVGLTLGAGGIAPYINDTIWYAGTYSSWKILDNGPLRSTFQLQYDNWDVAGRNFKMIKTVSIDAGSQMTKTKVQFETDGLGAFPFVVGIIKRKEAGEMLLNEKEGLMAYWEPQHGADGTTGVACLLTNPINKMQVNSEQLLASVTAQKGNEIFYFHGAAWDKAGKITSAKSWFQYLQDFKKRLEHSLIIEIK